MSVIYKNGTYYGAGGGGEGADTEIIADDFDPTESYAVGEYVVYEGALYKCTTAHTGAWDASNFDDTQVMAEMPTPMPAADMSEVVTPLPSVMSRRFKYSTEEQVVGEWIDGKPLYEKTVEATTPNKNTVQYTPVGASIETVVNYVAMFKNTPSTMGLNNWIKAGSLASQLENLSAGLVVHVYGNDATAGTPNSVVIRHNADGWGGKPLYVTIQYTKTTD